MPFGLISGGLGKPYKVFSCQTLGRGGNGKVWSSASIRGATEETDIPREVMIMYRSSQGGVIGPTSEYGDVGLVCSVLVIPSRWPVQGTDPAGLVLPIDGASAANDCARLASSVEAVKPAEDDERAA